MSTATPSFRQTSPHLTQESTPAPLSSTMMGQPSSRTRSIRVVIPSTQATVHVTTSVQVVIVGQEHALTATVSVDAVPDRAPDTPDHGHTTHHLPPPLTQDVPETRILLCVPERVQQRNNSLSASSMVDGLDADAVAEPQAAGAGASVRGLIMSSMEGEGHEHEKEGRGHDNRPHTVSAGSPVDEGAHEDSDAPRSVCA
ncbi:hypothetical protein VTO73DRAFT_2209 [Trametes versicolor]